MTLRWAGPALLGLIALLGGCAPVPTPDPAARPADFLIQTVCVDAADTPVFADPVDCPDRRRKPRIGEPLPYHKIDVGHYQISDSYPVADANGLTLGVQSYFFADAFDDDPAFPDQVHHDPDRGGYNILGADDDFVFFRGTSDPGAYWQPWWTPDCRAQGWLLYPNDRRAFRRGRAASPATFAPGCAGRIRANASTVEWRFIPDHSYVADAADPARTRRLDSIQVRHFSAGHGSMETNYFTREYGATRWEAWLPGEGLTPAVIKDRCPDSVYQARFHGKVFSMTDCRTWITLVRPEGGAWDPDGFSALDPTIRTFPVDPLYTGRNLLTNTHLGGPHEPNGAFDCDARAWRVVSAPSPLALGEVATRPWKANGACVRTIMAERLPAGAYVQTIAAPPGTGPLRFGVSLFAPDLEGTASLPVQIRLVQHGSDGLPVSTQSLTASVISRYRTFEGVVAQSAEAVGITLEISPAAPGVRVAVTGAFVAR